MLISLSAVGARANVRCLIRETTAIFSLPSRTTGIRRLTGRGVALCALLWVSFPALAQTGAPQANAPAAAAATAAAPAPAPAEPAAPAVSGSGLPVPRFVSLKADRVNLRNGPGTDYPTGWVFRRVGLPVEVVKEYEGWRQVRDSEGATGWVVQSLLSGRRTALVLPWERKSGQQAPLIPILASDTESSTVVAKVEAGVIADLHGCDGRWCSISIDAYKGYMEQKKLWGVYEGEVVK